MRGILKGYFWYGGETEFVLVKCFLGVGYLVYFSLCGSGVVMFVLRAWLFRRVYF